MKRIEQAIEEERIYITDRLNNINTSLIDRLMPYGYTTLNEYFYEKREYLFNEWKPEVYYVDVKTLTTELENAVQNEKYGIYFSIADDLYAFHGSNEIDYGLCKELGVTVAELYYNGGTIIGGVEDLGIEIIAPVSIGLDSRFMLNKIHDIIKRYEENAVISGNDILVNGDKVLGSMSRNVGNTFVWAAQISFSKHDDVIEKICSKRSIKRPGLIDRNKLTRDMLKREILKWLLKL